MKLKIEDLDRLEKFGIGGGVTYEEQMALIKLARESFNKRKVELEIYFSNSMDHWKKISCSDDVKLIVHEYGNDGSY